MNRLIPQLTLALALVAASLSAASTAHAQDAPDVRNLRPIVMLLVDSSGSMQREGNCVCRTATCEECLPNCRMNERNRWSTVVEAMTGTYEEWACFEEDRYATSYSRQPDYRYYIPHYLHPGQDFMRGGTFRSDITQRNDGILDSYAERIKFGLMTFDGVSTLRSDPFLVEEARWNTAYRDRSDDAEGGYSYGGAQRFTFPGCTTAYYIDNGAQRDFLDGGSLVSVGNDIVTDIANQNRLVQESLLRARPFGPTPIAGMLEDLDFYFENHPDVSRVLTPGGTGDPWALCRDRYAILLTDGYPNSDARGAPYNCDTPGSECPYDRSQDIARRLCDYDPGSGACDGTLDGLFVVGFDVPDAQAISELNSIAEAGGTCATPGGDCAYLVDSDPSTDDAAALRAAMSAILDRAAPGTTTRTVPAFAGSTPGADTQGQSQFNTGFRLPSSPGEPWMGVLERRRFECSADLRPESQTIEDRDRFHEILNNRTAPRNLLTVVPNNWRNTEAHLVGDTGGLSSIGGGPPPPRGGRGGGSGGPSCDATGRPTRGGGHTPRRSAGPAETGLTMTPFRASNSLLTRRVLGVANDATRRRVIDFVEGTLRPDRKMGDIYHSSPVVVPAPAQDLPDESFNLFRRRPEVANRPKVVYVGTNDGIMHAFAAEDQTITVGPYAGRRVTAGEELWGFIPPILLPKLASTLASHQWMVDGTPVVKDIYFRRGPGDNPDGNDYHTVLLFGLRGGGSAYIALDVTDPFDPQFLWQSTYEGMGLTYGTPGLGQVLVEDTSGRLQEIGLALLPGGVGVDESSVTCGGVPTPRPDGTWSKPIGCPSRGKGTPPINDGTTRARENQRCWDDTGRALYFVDPATGELISHLDDRVFNAPVTGGVSFFTGDVGTVANRAYLTDADGVIWRIDMSSARMEEWDADPFHDIFWDGDATDGQPAYHPPIVTTDQEGQVVIIQSTGDIDQLDGRYYNKVVSITEQIDFDPDGSINEVTASLNWEVRLDDGEQVTGPLELFNGKVYFATFRSTSDLLNACNYGESRIWGVEYIQSEDGTQLPAGGLEIPADSGTFVRHTDPLANQIVLGVAVTQRPTCSQLNEVSETDPYVGTRRFMRVQDSNVGDYQLVAQISGGGSASLGGSIAEFSRSLPAPIAFTQVQGWAGTID